MKLQLEKASTSIILTVFIQDSSSTTGRGLAGLDQNSSIVGGYVRMGETGVALAVDENVTTEGTYEAPSTAAQIRIGTPANMRAGTYELHIHNDLLATGTDYVVITLGGASNMADLAIEIQLVDNVWDEVLTAATHNVPTSSGRRLRNLTDIVVTSGTAQGPGNNSNQIQLEAGEPAVSDIFDPSTILLTAGVGAGQSRRIIEYDGATKIAIVSRTWKTAPDATTGYIVLADPGGLHVNEGLAQSGESMMITLNALASSVNNAYVGQTVFLVSGVGEDQARVVTAYNGTTKVATVNRDWDTTPDTTTGYLMLPMITVTVENTVAAILAETPTAGGVNTIQDMLLTFFAMARGRITKSGSNYTLYDDDDVTALFTLTIAESERTTA